mgnify:CR=1 FL=1
MIELPKAQLLSLRWSWAYFYFAKFRLANAVRLQIGWLTVTLRAPWHEQSKRAYAAMFSRPAGDGDARREG